MQGNGVKFKLVYILNKSYLVGFQINWFDKILSP
jgi:hypothetical protein